jgi:O-antigen ligase
MARRSAGTSGLILRTAAAGSFALAAVLVVTRYPLPAWSIAGPLAAYAALLWWRPAAFLLVIPCVLPAWDLGLWTGWMMIGESDLFIAVTVAVLLLRTPPRAADLGPRGLPGIALLVFAAAWIIATVAGLASPLGAPQSDNPFLRPDNALRLAKGFVEAVALLPFIRQRERLFADAVVRLGWGMALGIVAVTAVVLAERALFPGILDFSSEYRVAGPFSSMRVGGGHIGAYIALALPMTLCLTRLRPRWAGAGLLLLTCLAGGYTLAVTFARTAYAAGGLAMAVAGTASLLASRRRDRIIALGVLPVALVIAALAFAATLPGMRDRFAASAADFVTRQDNWRAGLAVRDTGPLPTLFGMGLGTYQRAMLMRSPVNRPSDIVIRRDADGAAAGAAAGAYVSMRVETPFYLGQKIDLPDAGDMILTLRARSPDGGATVGVLVCDKVLLYSDNCRGSNDRLALTDSWATMRTRIPVDGLGARTLFGVLRRPVELSLSGPIGRTLEVGDITLTDAAGRPMLVNGDFALGLDRWIFTDDSHVSWRMLNQYLMLWFETGAFGLLAYLGLSGVALAGGLRAARSGAVSGAAVAGSITGFLVSGLFDNVLEAPRLATLFFLICLCGLLQWEIRARPSV